MTQIPYREGMEPDDGFRFYNYPPPAPPAPPVAQPTPPPGSGGGSVATRALAPTKGTDYTDVVTRAAAAFDLTPQQAASLSDKDKYRMLLHLGANMMAAAGRPGAGVAESLAAGVQGALQAEQQIKGERHQAGVEREQSRQRSIDQALKLAQLNEQSRRNALRDALYRTQVERSGRTPQIKPFIDATGTAYDISTGAGHPIMGPQGLPLRQDVTKRRDVAQWSLRKAAELQQNYSPIFNGKSFGQLSPDEQQSIVAALAEQQFAAPSQPYGDPIAIAPDQFVDAPPLAE